MRVLVFPGSSMKNPPQNFFYEKPTKKKKQQNVNKPWRIVLAQEKQAYKR